MANSLGVMIATVVIALLVMLKYAGVVSDIVHRHPTLKMLALSFLLLIGVTLVAEGTHRHVQQRLRLLCDGVFICRRALESPTAQGIKASGFAQVAAFGRVGQQIFA